MDAIVDLLAWRRGRSAPQQDAPSNGEATVVRFPALEAPEAGDDAVLRLERAIARLYDVVSSTLLAGERVDGRIETEMLAIIGELAMDSVEDAIARAERLSQALDRDPNRRKQTQSSR